MKNGRLWKRLLALLLAVLMMTSCMGVTAFADPGDDEGGEGGDDPILEDHNCAVDGHEFVDGYCSYCGEVDPEWVGPDEPDDWNCDVDGHDYGADGYCTHCGEADPDWDCEVYGHEFCDGWCLHCDAQDPEWDEPLGEEEWDCDVDVHEYDDGYCIHCGAQQPVAPAVSIGDYTLYSGFTATAGCEGTFSTGEVYSRLVDGNTSSKWCTVEGGSFSTKYIQFNASSAIVPKGYILYTGNDVANNPNRLPLNWTLKGKLNADDDWTTLASVSNDTTLMALNTTAFQFPLNNTAGYQYFRFEVTAIHGQASNNDYTMELGELQLYGTAYEPDPGPGPSDPEPELYPVTVTAVEGVDVWTGYEGETEFAEGEWVYLFFDVPEGYEPVAAYTVAGDDTVWLIDTYDDSDYGWCGGFDMPAAAVSVSVTLGGASNGIEFYTEYEDGFEAFGVSMTLNGAAAYIDDDGYANARVGDTVVLNFVPDEGVNIVNVSSEQAEISFANGVWSFTMPDEFVEISVEAVYGYLVTVDAPDDLTVTVTDAEEETRDYYCDGATVQLSFPVEEGYYPQVTYTVPDDEEWEYPEYAEFDVEDGVCTASFEMPQGDVLVKVCFPFDIRFNSPDGFDLLDIGLTINGEEAEISDDGFARACEGDEIAFTLAHEHGYVLAGVLCYSDGENYEIEPEDGVYSFVMPACETMIYADLYEGYGVTYTAPEGVHIYVQAVTPPTNSVGEGSDRIYIFHEDDGVYFEVTVPEGYAPTVIMSVAGSEETEELDVINTFDANLDGIPYLYEFTMPDDDVHLTVTTDVMAFAAMFTTEDANGDSHFSDLGIGLTINGEESVIDSDGFFMAAMGDTVAMTFDPDDGWNVEGVTAQSVTSGTELTVTSLNGVWSFTMPADNVEVTVAVSAGYPVTVTAPEDTEVELCDEDENECESFEVGDDVYLWVYPPFGYAPAVTYTVEGDDTLYTVEMNLDWLFYEGCAYGSFEMPAGAVSVSVTLEQIPYRISFEFDYDPELLGMTLVRFDEDGSYEPIELSEDDYYITAEAGEVIGLAFDPEEPLTVDESCIGAWGYNMEGEWELDVFVQDGFYCFVMPEAFVWLEVEADGRMPFIFNANNGSGETMEYTAWYMRDFDLPYNPFEAPEGTVFGGWLADEEIYWPGDEIDEVESAMTFTAVWLTPDEYPTVSFDANDGTGEMAPIAVEPNKAFFLPDSSFTAPEGTVFGGWLLGDEIYGPRQTLTITEDITLTANWVSIEDCVPISFQPGEGSGVMETVYAPPGLDFYPPAMTFTAPEGKVFDYWRVNTPDGSMGSWCDELGSWHVSSYYTDGLIFTAMWKTATEWDALRLSLREGGTVTLTDDVYATETSDTILIPQGVSATLNLAGHSIDMNGREVTMFKVNGALTLTDSVGGGTLTGAGGDWTYVVEIPYGGSFTMNGGAISGNELRYSPVQVEGVFTMNGGTISDNISDWDSGAVTLESNASFTMNGGSITGNTGSIGGILVRSGGSSFTMNGGSITENTATSYNPGGVMFQSGGVFTMTDGTISNNTGTEDYAGGVAVAYDSIFNMSGGTISGNSGGYGGGVLVYNDARFNMSGGTISGNEAGQGGGVYVKDGGVLTMTGGLITDNEAGYFEGMDEDDEPGLGGGVYVGYEGAFHMSGGEIAGNAACYGGGAFVERRGSVSMSGSPQIYDNIHAFGGPVISDGGEIGVLRGIVLSDGDEIGVIGEPGYNDDLCLAGGVIRITGALSSNARVGVATADEPRCPYVFTSGLQGRCEIYTFESNARDMLAVGINEDGEAYLDADIVDLDFWSGDPDDEDSFCIDMQVAEGSFVKLPACPFDAPEGMDFAGWKFSPMMIMTLRGFEGVAQDDAIYRPGDVVQITRDGALIAQWASPAPPLEITTQPEDATVAEDSTATFTVVATGDDLSYQWYWRNDANTAWSRSSQGNPTTATLSVVALARREGFQYYCEISNAAGTVSTNVVTLHIGTPLEITTQPSDYVGAVGDMATFTVAATGEDLSYQWYYKNSLGWAPASTGGAQTDTYTVVATQARNGYQYYCKVSNASGEVTTEIVTLSIAAAVTAPVITTQPVDAAAVENSTASFTVVASGDDLSYQWYWRNDANTAWSRSTQGNPTTATLSVAALARRNGFQYYCEISNAAGTVSTNVVTLHIGTPLEIVTQPSDYVGDVGDMASFTVAATGEGLTYQWYWSVNGSNWFTASSTTDTYSIELTEGRDGRYYYCEITDGSGNSLSTEVVRLHIAVEEPEALAIIRQPVDVTAALDEIVSFHVEASGEDLSYQWYYKNSLGWAAASTGGAKTDTYTVTATQARDGYQYYCKVSNASGEVTTEIVTLRIAAAVEEPEVFEITAQPSDYVGAVGDMATFTVAATGEGLTYQWYWSVNGSNWFMASSTTDTYSIELTKGRDGRYYYCEITDASGNSLSTDVVRLHIGAVVEPVVFEITTQPSDYVGAVGDMATFTVAATGEGLTYQWYWSVNGSNWFTASSTTESYSIELTEGRDGRYYYCEITDGSGNSLSTEVVRLHIGAVEEPEALAIIRQPVDVTAALDEIVSFHVEASGEDLSYQWYYKNSLGWAAASTSGARTDTYTVTATQARNGYQYYCKVSNASGEVTTEIVTLTVVG